MLINVKDTPELVLGPATPTTLIAFSSNLGLFRSFDEGERGSPELVYLNQHRTAVVALVEDQIDLLCHRPLGEDEDLFSPRLTGTLPARGRHYSLEAPIGSAVCLRRRREKIGVPP